MFDCRNLTDHVDATSTEADEIRRLPGGSIDHDFYRRRGRALHGSAVRFSGRRLWDNLVCAVRHGFAPRARGSSIEQPLLPALPAE